MRIIITMDPDPEIADPAHPMGITEEGYDKLSEALGEFGTNIEVSREGA